MRSMTEENIMGARATQVAAKSRIVSGTAAHQARLGERLHIKPQSLQSCPTNSIFLMPTFLPTFLEKKNYFIFGYSVSWSRS